MATPIGLRDMAALQQFFDYAIDGLGGQGYDRLACEDRVAPNSSPRPLTSALPDWPG